LVVSRRCVFFGHGGSGADIVFKNNTVESNDTGLLVGTDNLIAKDNDDDLQFVNTVCRKSAEGISRPFVACQLGTMEHKISNFSLIGSTYENGATDKIVWGGSGQKDVDFGWVLDVTVTDPAGRPVQGPRPKSEPPMALCSPPGRPMSKASARYSHIDRGLQP
jgi:hypothetical protein